MVIVDLERVFASRAIKPGKWNGWQRGRDLFDAAAVQVGLDLQPRPAAEARAIDLQILDDPLHVVPGLGERDQFDPVDGVDLGIARVAVTLDPLFDAAAPGIVGGKGHDVGAAVILDQAAEFGRAKCRIVDRVGLQPAEVEARAVFLADIFAGIRRHLH